MPAPKQIYLISDSTGELGARFVNALISQFPNDAIQIKRFNFITDEAEAKKAFTRITPTRSVLFHTVLSRDLKRTLSELSHQKKIAAFDLTGPATDFLIRHLKGRPVWNVSAIHPINEEYQRRINAIEFTIGHDDGAGSYSLRNADVILVGPSRSSKTPTSMYLAIKGYRVANVPLVQELDLTERLETLRGDGRVIAFVISPEKLHEVRLKRATELGASPSSYTDLAAIAKELRWCRQLYQRYDWKTIDVTDRAIEETAALVMRQIRPRRRN